MKTINKHRKEIYIRHFTLIY